jgi:hypothetical protein
VVGISPACTLKEHVETYRSPCREYDILIFLIFTGLGLMGRELIARTAGAFATPQPD